MDGSFVVKYLPLDLFFAGTGASLGASWRFLKPCIGRTGSADQPEHAPLVQVFGYVTMAAANKDKAGSRFPHGLPVIR